MGYIYKITNHINNKIYIGQTRKERPTDRWSQHRYCGRYLSKENTSILHKAMNKYGLENFSFEIVEQVDNDLLNEREIYWINFFQSKTPNGYNLTDGGGGAPGRPCKYKGIERPPEVIQKIKNSWTPERRKAQSEKMKGKNNPMYGRTGSLNPFYGKKGNLNHQYWKGKIGRENPFFGKHHTEETKKILSQAQDYKKKRVGMFDKNTDELIREFDSLADAGRFINGDDGYISKACRRKTRTGSNLAYGYRWNFIEGVSTNLQDGDQHHSKRESPLLEDEEIVSD